MSFLRMQESPNLLFIKRFRDKPGMTNRSDFGLLIQPHVYNQEIIFCRYSVVYRYLGREKNSVHCIACRNKTFVPLRGLTGVFIFVIFNGCLLKVTYRSVFFTSSLTRSSFKKNMLLVDPPTG